MKIIITEEQYSKIFDKDSKWANNVEFSNAEVQNKEHNDALKKTGFWGKVGAGCIIMATDTGRILLPLRSKWVREPGTWGTWGGAIDDGESPEMAAMREVSEEAGYIGKKKIIPLHVFNHPSGFKYHNFLILVSHEFKPKLNHETDKAYWFYVDELPSPLHFGLEGIVNNNSDSKIITDYANQINENINKKSANNKQVIITEEQFKQLIYLDERRSNPDINKDPSFNDFFDKLISTYNIDDIFVSFRRTMDVTDVNPKNQYNTPTGFYTYPLKSYKDDINQIKNNNYYNDNKTLDEKNFRALFPFQNELPYINFLVLHSHDGVLSESTPKETLNIYVNRIKELYLGAANSLDSLMSEKAKIDDEYNNMNNVDRDRSVFDDFKKKFKVINDKIEKSNSADYVCKICDEFVNEKYVPRSKYNPKHQTHNFWLLLYDITTKLTDSYPNETNMRVTTLINVLCQKIGVNGFADYDGLGYIHGNEKRQAVFFKVKNIGNLYVYTKPKNDNLMNINDSIYNVINRFESLNEGGKIYMLKQIIENINPELLKKMFDYIGYSKMCNFIIKLGNPKYMKMLPNNIVNLLTQYAETSADKIESVMRPLIIKSKQPLNNTDVTDILNNLKDNHEIDDNNNITKREDALATIRLMYLRNYTSISKLSDFLIIIKQVDINKYNELMGEYINFYDEKNYLNVSVIYEYLNNILNKFEKQIKR